MSRTDDRGQAHTLEAFAAAILIVAGLTFALQATAVTPLSASTSNQHLENQQRAVATDLLETSAANGDLREAILRWDPNRSSFRASGTRGQFTEGGPPNGFGEALDRAFRDGRIAFNVELRYGPRYGESEPMVDMGSPSDNAVTATRTVVLTDDANLTMPGYEDRTLAQVAADDDQSFYAEDPDSRPIYRVEVRITAWQL